MIQKVMPKVVVHKMPKRTLLKSVAGVGLLSLAGSSMSGYPVTPSVTKDMIIPGGLNLKEKAYYLITRQLPKSVKERLVEVGGDNIPTEGDQVVNLTMRGSYIEFINEGPHGVTDVTPLEPIDSLGAGSLVDAGDVNGLLDGADGDSNISTFEIWEHLSGL